MRTIVLLAAAGLASLPAQNPVAAVEGSITEASILGPLRFLSHDLLEGRGMGTKGEHLARLYLATQLESYGFRPGGEGGWEQAVPILGIHARVERELTVRGADASKTLSLKAPADYTAVAGNAAAEAAWNGAEIVFVGYGIHAPEKTWDDYKDADLRGKVLLVMNDDPHTEKFAGATRLYYGRWSYKYEEAARRGAAGAIVIHTNTSAGYPFQVVQSNHDREAFWLPPGKDQPGLDVRAWCTEDAAKSICTLAGQDLVALRARAEREDFAPVRLGVRADLAIRNTVREIRSANVVGVLEGSDPKLKDEHVVVTAHFDHLGIGPEKKGDSIYNGAVDNASGCATALNVARACAALPPRPRRSVLVLFVTGEESGLLGSLWFALHPTVDKKRLVANFNIDSVNVWGRTRDVAMVGWGKNDLGALAAEVARGHGREVVPDPDPGLGLYYRSDHFSLARIGVPSAYFKAGKEFDENPEGRRRVAAMYTTVHYHQPSDELDERFKLDGAVADARFVLECLVRCANAEQAPAWTKGDEFEKLR